MSKTLSFIIPAYNAQAYLEKCLDSLVVEACLPALEIIVVNDGSSDATANIASDYVARYPQTVFLLNKENGGHGSAINAGLEQAQGCYFRVLDADDWIVSDNLPLVISKLAEQDVDALIFDFDTYDINTAKRRLYSVATEYGESAIGIKELLAVYGQVARNCSFHGICYNSEFYRSTGLQLTEKIFYDDNEFAIIPMLDVETLRLIPLAFYQYRIGDVNQSVAFPSQVKRMGNYEAVIYHIVAARQGRQLEPEREEYYLRQLSQLVVSYLAIALVKNPQKPAGRKLAQAMMEYLSAEASAVLPYLHRKYSLMLALNRLHVSPLLYQGLLDSGLYRAFQKRWI